MGNQLFRKKSLDRISSPEELHDYMRVTSPRLWMILSAILVLVAGFIAYASTTTMESTVPVKVLLESYEGTNEEEGDWRITSVTGTWPDSSRMNSIWQPACQHSSESGVSPTARHSVSQGISSSVPGTGRHASSSSQRMTPSSLLLP